MNKTIEELITDETERRLKEMFSESYVFPKSANRHDYIGILASVIVCTVLIVLCLTEVIV